VFEAIRDTGFFRLWVPRNLGGAEVDPETSLDIVEEFARQDGAVGWSVMIAGNNSVLWGYLAAPAAAEIMAGNHSAVLAGSILAGSGTATPTEGGYRITGRWPFASGCDHADHMIGGCRLADNPEQMRAFILPIAHCSILDTWSTAGLRGTASHDFVAEDVFVPHGNDFPYPFPGGCQAGPLYNTPIPNIWAPNISGVALGIARDAIDTFVEIAAGKRSLMGRALLAERETIQERVGRAEDVHMVPQHTVVGPAAVPMAGRAFLGVG